MNTFNKIALFILVMVLATVPAFAAPAAPVAPDTYTYVFTDGSQLTTVDNAYWETAIKSDDITVFGGAFNQGIYSPVEGPSAHVNASLFIVYTLKVKTMTINGVDVTDQLVGNTSFPADYPGING